MTDRDDDPVTGRDTGPVRPNPQQALFAMEYCVDLCGKAAAIRAGYSEVRASRTASELLRKPHVLEMVRQQMAAREARTLVNQDRVVQELARIAFADLRSYMKFGPGGVCMRDSNELTEDEARALVEVTESQGETRTIKIKLADKIAALRELGKHLGVSGKVSARVSVSVGEGGDEKPEGGISAKIASEIMTKVFGVEVPAFDDKEALVEVVDA